MANKEVLNLEVKANIKQVAKDTEILQAKLENTKLETKELIKDFGAFGITVGSVKQKFADAAKIMGNGLKIIKLQAGLAAKSFQLMFGGKMKAGAKVLFRTIAAGVAATGIGLLVVAFASVSTYLTSTKEGAEKLEKALKTVGTTIAVITDRISGLGKIITNIFSKPLGESLKDVKENFKGVTEEIKEEVKVTMKMVDASQKLRDAQRALNVETAQSVADIEKLKLVAEDITKSYDEREKAAVAAFEKETKLESARIKLAEENLRLIKIDVGLGESLAEDLDRQAEAEIALANVRQEAAGRQISLQNFLNGLRATEQAEKDAAKAKEKADDDAFWAKKIADNDKWNEKQIADAKIVADKKIAIFQAEENFKKATIDKTFGAAAAMAGENVALSKGVAAAQTIYQTQQGIMAAMGATSVGDKLLPYPVRLANAIATGIMGTAALSKIMSTDPSGGAAGGGGGAAAAASSGTPAPEMLSGAFTLGGGITPEPARAYVVSDDITNNQNKLAIIRRRATI